MLREKSQKMSLCQIGFARNKHKTQTKHTITNSGAETTSAKDNKCCPFHVGIYFNSKTIKVLKYWCKCIWIKAPSRQSIQCMHSCNVMHYALISLCYDMTNMHQLLTCFRSQDKNDSFKFFSLFTAGFWRFLMCELELKWPTYYSLIYKTCWAFESYRKHHHSLNNKTLLKKNGKTHEVSV